MIKTLEGFTKEVSLEGSLDPYIEVQAEAALYYTLTDAYELIQAIGLSSFLEALYHEKQGRLLTVEEHEAIQALHESWEL